MGGTENKNILSLLKLEHQPMKLFDYLERLQRLHFLIKRKQTGTPQGLASKLCLRTSQLYNVIEELKRNGAPITYCRIRKTFFYSVPFEINIQCEFKVLAEEEKQINTGGLFFSKNFFLPILLESGF
ncbi:hypothetical protein NF867_11875 [Solitalea sp. MAHUQ-68]|uniref:HTH domain-containing protein n=1 Tax=Solitalea agri TaxID=2953739 RepID=A0A9X2FAW7_9SPHI|nr:hypothetical protein [Solitalea agri]MCO4293563.1 hypothetical protein [Solitalea agri]